jgi:hypothetical protein
MSDVGILNVGCGDTKLSFDPKNPADCIRAARIVKDMLRRGFALIVEVEENGVKVNRRVHDFDETKCEYIIADFDPLVAADVDNQGRQDEETNSTEAAPASDEVAAAKGSSRKQKRRIPARGAKAVAVPHIAGG